MKIVDSKTQPSEVRLRDVVAGTVVRSNGKLFMMVNIQWRVATHRGFGGYRGGIPGETCVARSGMVNLETGECRMLSNDPAVYEVGTLVPDAELHV